MTFENPICAVQSGAESLRHVHHVAVGINKTVIPPYQVDDAFRAMQNDLTRLLGGVTAWLSDGTWTPYSEFGNYDGAIERDVTLNFLLTMTESECAKVWSDLQIAIANVVLEHGLGCEYIHTMMWPAQSRIFRVSEVALKPANQNKSYHISEDVAGDTSKTDYR